MRETRNNRHGEAILFQCRRRSTSLRAGLEAGWRGRLACGDSGRLRETAAGVGGGVGDGGGAENGKGARGKCLFGKSSVTSQVGQPDTAPCWGCSVGLLLGSLIPDRPVRRMLRDVRRSTGCTPSGRSWVQPETASDRKRRVPVFAKECSCDEAVAGADTPGSRVVLVSQIETGISYVSHSICSRPTLFLFPLRESLCDAARRGGGMRCSDEIRGKLEHEEKECGEVDQ